MSKAVKRKLSNNMEDPKPECTKGSANITNLVCDLCKIELPNETSLTQHLLGQKHTKLDNAEKERKRVERKCGIFIRGFPPNVTQDIILKYFSAYGKIVWIHFGHSFVLMDFTEPVAVEKVMKKDHYLGGRQLMIKYRQLKKQQGYDKKPAEDESNDFIQKLKDVQNFKDQVQILIRNLQPHMQKQAPKYRNICDELYNILSATFPQCQIHPFGSTITGLNFNNSDIDVFIAGVKRDDNDVPFLYRTKALLLNSRRFSNVIVIPQAKIPILKCVHVATGISCDLNVKNMLGVCNSQLISYYLKIDHKIKKTMMVLKYWAKVHKITGQNHLFSNYSLCMMLIFFLQQDPYNIPSVMSLQYNIHYSYYHDGWNGGFQQILVRSFPLKDTSVFKLLERFFTFYVEFEYGTNIICPYLGRVVRRDEFRTPETLPGYFDSYKNYIQVSDKPLKIDTTICLQDPFELSRNTTPIVSTSVLDKFVSFCRLGKKLCENNESMLLYNILTTVPPNLKSELTPELGQCSIPMSPSLKYIEEKIEGSSNRQDAIHEAWFKSVVNFTTIVLKDFFKLELTELHSSINSHSKSKNSKIEGQSDVYSEVESRRVSYQCVGKLNLWHGRKSVAKHNKSEGDPKQTIIESEITVTDQICSLYKNIPQLGEIINLELTLEHNLTPPATAVKLKKNSSYKNTFKSFATYFFANLPIWFKIYEKEQNEYMENISK